jgi:hypothetical protein
MGRPLQFCSAILGSYLSLNTLLYSGNQIVFADSESKVHRTHSILRIIVIKYNLWISEKWTSVRLRRDKHLKVKTVINNQAVEQFNFF